LYAAVGAHSGLPQGAAHDVASAFGAMKGGPVRRPRADAAAASDSQPLVPTIVFHGDDDQTVVPRNGDAIVEQAAATGESRLSASVKQGGCADGRHYTRTVYVDDSGSPRVEHWVLHGAGHAWSGGSAEGSYTDATGPDASAEMIRFFLNS
jgi:poly(3-hydroxybutyrate) depolymerase